MKSQELTLKADLLDVIERHRQKTGNADLGAELEKAILSDELRQLDSDVSEGEHALVLLRKRKASKTVDNHQ